MSENPVLLDDWHPVASVENLDATGLVGVRLLEVDIVVWRAGETLRAWRDRCVHRGTKLSMGRIRDGNRLQCPYHGWVYDRDGRCVEIPAMPGHPSPETARVDTYPVIEGHGLVWVCLGTPPVALPPFPEWDETDFRKILCGPYRVKSSGPRIIENFLDVAHFAYVHDEILGVRANPEVADYEVAVGPAGIEATDVSVYQPDPYGTGQGDTVRYTYQVHRPLTAYLRKQSDGPRFSILLTITPHAATESSAWMTMAMNYGHEIPRQELIAWQDEIFAQDQPIVESQSPAELPLDPTAEVSMRCDRAAVAYRKWLRDLGMTYGVI